MSAKRWSRAALPATLLCVFPLAFSAQQAATPAPSEGGPTDAKAVKSYESARQWEMRGQFGAAFDDYKKASRQDGGGCADCLIHAYRAAEKVGAYKDAEVAGQGLLRLARGEREQGNAHYLVGRAIQEQAIAAKKEALFGASRAEFEQALALNPGNTSALFNLGVALAHLHEDATAVDRFKEFLGKDRMNSGMHERAERFVERIELARATMAPAFGLTTLDGRRVTMDSLAGNVVLIDFWATWCGPCREALPHIREIARKFEGQPLVVLSISLDMDEGKWREFVAKNQMTWPQAHDAGFGGPIAKDFQVKAIPATFTIDADGVLEDQHVGDAAIEGKLKKLVARAAEAGSKRGLSAAGASPAAPQP